jgi:hypothetical protein
MPRKQRFKPSRKPKPTVTEESPKPMVDQQQARSPISEAEVPQDRMDERLDRNDGSSEERPSE